MAAITVTTIFSDFDMTYKGVPTAVKIRLLKTVDKLITRHFGLRKKELAVAVTEESGVVSLDARVMWIESARWINQPHGTPGRIGGSLLTESNVDEQDMYRDDWRASAPSTPSEFMQSHNLTGGQLQFDCPTLYGTLVATAATNADPIVVTSSAAHGLSDGDRVDIRNGLVNTNVNGDHYAKVTGYGTTTFALYSDEDLTTSIAGNGVYTASSALINCANSPYLQLFTRWHDDALDASSSLPDTALYPNLYVDGMCFEYARRRVEKDIPKYKALFEDVINEQIFLTQKRAGRKPMHLEIVHGRSESSVSRSRW